MLGSRPGFLHLMQSKQKPELRIEYLHLTPLSNADITRQLLNINEGLFSAPENILIS